MKEDVNEEVQEDVGSSEYDEQYSSMKRKLLETAATIALSCLSAACTGFFIQAGSSAYGRISRKP